MTIDPAAYERVIHHAGVMNVSGMYGRVAARGREAIDLLHRMSTNDLKPLEGASGAALTVLTNEKARFIDAIKVVKDSHGHTLLITSGGKEQDVIQWLDRYVIMEDAQFTRATEAIGQCLVCGPESRALLQHYCGTLLTDARDVVYDAVIDGLPATIVKAPSLAGEGWFVLGNSEAFDRVLGRLEADALALDGTMIDASLFDLLRIENGSAIYPNEINDKHNPLETGFATEAVSFTKGCYIGQEVIARLDAQQKVQRHLVRVEIAVPSADAESELMNATLPLKLIAAADVEARAECGEFTSYAVNPLSQRVVGLGYVRSAFVKAGGAIGVAISDAIVLPAVMHTL